MEQVMSMEDLLFHFNQGTIKVEVLMEHYGADIVDKLNEYALNLQLKPYYS